MRAVVTGGAGFIGSHLVDALVDCGGDVVVLDDLSTGRRGNLADGVTLVEADVADAIAVGRIFEEHEPAVVFHLAAQIDVRRSVADPAHDARVNVEGTIVVLEAARRHGARVVFSSTGGAIYGDNAVVPTPEDAPRRPLAPYGQGKAAAEDYCALYARLHGADVSALRYANVYGPRQDPLGEGGVVAIFTQRAQRGEPAPVYGDGRQTRDFVYVDDVVAANLLAAQRPGAARAYNVGRGEETSVLELAVMLGVAVEHQAERPGEVRRSCLDPARARRELGWEAQVDMPTGLERTMRWRRSH
jgi:UDP-glucose 4-epimerase